MRRHYRVKGIAVWVVCFISWPPSRSDYSAVARGKVPGRHLSLSLNDYSAVARGKDSGRHLSLSRSDYSAVARGKASGRHPG